MLTAIQGGQASFHQQAADLYLGSPEILECRTFRELCSSVAQGKTDNGLMAVENTLAGSILPNYSLLEEFPLYITGEVYLRIEHHLMALPGTEPDDILFVISHPMALMQCSKYLETHPDMKGTEFYDTADAARMIFQEQLSDTAAIASKKAASLYGLKILDHNIENIKDNYTRFLLVSPKQQVNDKADKASVNFRLEHRPGALAEALSVLAENEINLTLLQSLPIPGSPKEYAFHADLQWKDINRFYKAIESLKSYTREIKILGIYCSGKLPYENENFKAA